MRDCTIFSLLVDVSSVIVFVIVGKENELYIKFLQKNKKHLKKDPDPNPSFAFFGVS